MTMLGRLKVDRMTVYTELITCSFLIKRETFILRIYCQISVTLFPEPLQFHGILNKFIQSYSKNPKNPQKTRYLDYNYF